MKYAHSKLEFIPPKYNVFVLKIFHLLLPIFLRFRLRPWLVAGITNIKVINAEILVELYEQFQKGKIRLIIAFRHPEIDDPLCLTYLLSRVVPKVAREKKIKLKYPIHSYFIYDRGMTIWGGNWLGWLFSKGGGIPIHRGKPLDRKALKTARDLLINGKFPLMIAPEGGNNLHSDIVSKLQLGVAQLGVWCVEDLFKENRTEEVLIVPINIQYKYIKNNWYKLDNLLCKLEKDSGLEIKIIKEYSNLEKIKNLFYERLLILSDKILTSMENFYSCFYHVNISQVNILEIKNCEIEMILSEENKYLANNVILRLDNLLHIALEVTEEYFKIKKKGSLIDRCRRLEEASWGYIYREDIKDFKNISSLDKNLAEWIANEAQLRVKHMRLVENFVAMTADYIREKPTFDRFTETSLILFDVMAKIKGEKIPKRPRLGKRITTLTIGKTISVKEYFNNENLSKRKRKQAVNNITYQLQKTLEKNQN